MTPSTPATDGDPPRSIEDRVTALEQLLAQPPSLTISAPGGDLDDDERTRLRENFERAYAEESRHPLKVLPPVPLLTPALARELLRECVTVVRPGETLVVRVPDTWTAQQVFESQRLADQLAEARGWESRILLVRGEEFAVMVADSPNA